MNNQDVGLDQLFASARQQVPEYSFDETKKQFLGSLVIAAGGVLATKGIISLFTKKWIIMMTIATITTSAAIVASTYSFTDSEPPVEESIPVSTEEIQDTEEDELVEEPEETILVEEDLFEEDVAEVEEEQLFEEVEAEDISDKDAFVVHAPLFDDDAWYLRTNDRDRDRVLFVDLTYPPDTIVKTEDGETIKRYIITHETTEAELEEIKADAEKVGIKFSYSAHYDDGKLEQVSIAMKLKYKDEDGKGDMSQTIVTDEIKKNDEIEIGWIENEKGKARRLGTNSNGNGCNCDCGDNDDSYNYYEFHLDDFEDVLVDFEDSMNDFEDSMNEFSEDFNDFSFNMNTDSAGVYAFSISCGDFADDFEFEFPELPDLDEMNEEMLEELEEKLEEIEEKLEEIEEKLEELEEEEEEE